MSEYDQATQSLLNKVEDVVVKSVSITSTVVETIASGIKPKAKIEISSTKNDVKQAQKAIAQGVPKSEIIKTIKQSPVAKRLKAMGRDVDKYANLVFKKGQIEEAVARNPGIAKTQQKTLEKTL
ncbi:MAG: hypothetical protein QNJ60_00350 [Xenococcaceae cyanobacterium MO_188.B19]|nr:hypothetical protein [Xenococcaceae cyanobacterium MO_188.B19]